MWEEISFRRPASVVQSGSSNMRARIARGAEALPPGTLVLTMACGWPAEGPRTGVVGCVCFAYKSSVQHPGVSSAQDGIPPLGQHRRRQNKVFPAHYDRGGAPGTTKYAHSHHHAIGRGGFWGFHWDMSSWLQVATQLRLMDFARTKCRFPGRASCGACRQLSSGRCWPGFDLPGI